MKRLLLAAVLCVGLATSAVPPAGAQLQAPNPQAAQANLQATRQYYIVAIAGPSPNLAALTLLMTMMPKGGDLHHHYGGAIYAENFLDWVKEAGACIFRADVPAANKRMFTVADKPGELPESARAVCLDADQVRSSQHLGFYRELLSAWSDKDFANHFHQQVPPDQHFFATFSLFGGIPDNYANGLRLLKARAIAENVQYIETMLTRADLSPLDKNGALPREIDRLPADADEAKFQTEFVRLFDFLEGDKDTKQAIESHTAELDQAAVGIDDADFKLRFQEYTTRNDPPSKVFAGLYAAFIVASKATHVVAVNIVGPENGVVAMRDYGLHMRMIAFMKQKYPKVRLSLHAGELALGMVPPEGLQNHIREAVEIAGASRIGHGVDLPHERDATGLLRLMRERKVAVEINLTSNEFILGVKNEAHPLLLYRQIGVPFVISTDDAGVSRNNLSAEYVLYASRYKPSYDSIKETVFNSIRYSFLPDADKAAELRALQQRFAAFEAKVRDLANGLPGPQPAR